MFGAVKLTKNADFDKYKYFFILFLNQFFSFKFFFTATQNIIKSNNKKNNYMNQLLRLPLLKYTHTHTHTHIQTHTHTLYIYIYI